jgi:hypothetical protein
LTLFPIPRATRRAGLAATFAAATVALPGCSKHAPPPPAPAPAAPPADVPQDMVGVWTSTRGMVMRCIELHADGSYMMVPNTEAGDHLNYQGSWRVADGRITWRDTSQDLRPDVNVMESVSTGHFTTIEVDNSRTQFDRIAGPGEKCPSEVSK